MSSAAVVIDTGVDKEKTEAASEPLPLAMSNEAETDVQKALKMDDELANHATIVFEENDATAESVNQEKLQKEFDSALKFTGSKNTLHELYSEEL